MKKMQSHFLERRYFKLSAIRLVLEQKHTNSERRVWDYIRDIPTKYIRNATVYYILSLKYVLVD